MRFELGKYYRHTNGETIHVIGVANTWAYGWCFTAENPNTPELKPVGYTDDAYAQNWEEITVHGYIQGAEENSKSPEKKDKIEN